MNESGDFGVSYFPPAVQADLEVFFPKERTPGKAESLVSGKDVQYTHGQGHTTLRIKRLALFEAIKLVL